MTFTHRAAIEAINHRTQFANRRISIAAPVCILTVLISAVVSLTIYIFTVSLLLIWLPFLLGMTVTVFMLIYSYPPFADRRWAHRFPEKANRLKELDDYPRS